MTETGRVALAPYCSSMIDRQGGADRLRIDCHARFNRRYKQSGSKALDRARPLGRVLSGQILRQAGWLGGKYGLRNLALAYNLATGIHSRVRYS